MSKKTLQRLEIVCLIGLVASFALKIFSNENVYAMQTVFLGTLMLCAYFDEKLIPQDKKVFRNLALVAAIINYLAVIVQMISSFLN